MKRSKFLIQGTGAALLSVQLPAGFNNFFQFKTVTKPKFRTGICDLLNIEYPIIQAGMGGVAGAELVASVSNAGGLGILSGTMVPPEVLRSEIQKVRSLTDRPLVQKALACIDGFGERIQK